MMIAKAFESYSLTLRKLYEMLNELSIAGKIVLSLVMAISIGALAQIRVFLPWTPVPIVMTQLGVITSAYIMGRKWGIVPVLMYVLAGMLGMPWFSGFGSGIGYLLGPTGGYLIGFILSGWFISYIVNTYKSERKIVPLLGIIAVSQLIIIYIPGLLQLNFWAQATTGEALGFQKLMMMGFMPFLLGDLIKTVIGSLIIFSIGRR